MPNQPHAWTVETGAAGLLVASLDAPDSNFPPAELGLSDGALVDGTGGFLQAGGYGRDAMFGGVSRFLGTYGQGASAGLGQSFATRDTSVLFSGDVSLRYTFGDGGAPADWQGIISNDPVAGNFCIPLRPGIVYRVKLGVRTSSIAGAPKYRMVFTHTALGTLVSSKTVVFTAANTWESTEFLFAVPAGADANTRLAVQFQRGATAAQDFWVDAIRMDEVGYAAGMFEEASGKPMRTQVYPDGRYALQATETDGTTKSSSAHNPQGGILPFVSPINFFSYAAGGPAAGQMWISFGWSSQSLLLPDGSTKSVPAPPAAPAAPTTGTAVSGALGLRTLFAKVAYVKTDPITLHETLYPVSAEAPGQVVPANNVLTVTAPADPGGGLYDGWAVLVGSTTGVNYVQGVTAKRAFGANYQEPAGGFSTTQNSLWTASWKSITKIGLDPSVSYHHYPYFDIGKNFVYIPAETNAKNASLSILQHGDGVLSLGRYDSGVGYSGDVSFSTPAALSTSSGNVGGGRLN